MVLTCVVCVRCAVVRGLVQCNEQPCVFMYFLCRLLYWLFMFLVAQLFVLNSVSGGVHLCVVSLIGLVISAVLVCKKLFIWCGSLSFLFIVVVVVVLRCESAWLHEFGACVCRCCCWFGKCIISFFHFSGCQLSVGCVVVLPPNLCDMFFCSFKVCPVLQTCFHPNGMEEVKRV